MRLDIEPKEIAECMFYDIKSYIKETEEGYTDAWKATPEEILLIKAWLYVFLREYLERETPNTKESIRARYKELLDKSLNIEPENEE